MIFVTVGTNEAPFDRLLRAVDGAAIDEEVVVQHGSCSVRPRQARCIESVGYEELVQLVRQARVVVMHAGVGSVLTALANGKRPIVVPRLHRFGEAVDDHQLPFARRLELEGLVSLLEDPDRLAQAVRAAPEATSIELRADPQLVDDLRAFVEGGLADHVGLPSVAGAA
jgi:UDP-N-acetylglucosamine transferase subunit ALG13